MMMDQPKERQREEFIKGRFIDSTLVLAATPTSLLFYDIRKPSIILKDIHFEQILSQKEENKNAEQEIDEINDIDFFNLGDSKIKIAACFDSGETII